MENLNKVLELLIRYPILILIFWMVISSMILFLMMGIDKRKAKRNRRRIPEKRLFLTAILGGGIGGWIGMYTFRHKTKHWYFVIGFPLIALAQIAGVGYLLLKR